MNLKKYIPHIGLSILGLIVVGAFYVAWHVTVGSEEIQARTAEIEAERETACAGVTVENWGRGKDACIRASHRFMLDVRPCKVGGLPMFCKDKGDVILIWTWRGTPISYPRNFREDVRKHITYFSVTSSQFEKGEGQLALTHPDCECQNKNTCNQFCKL